MGCDIHIFTEMKNRDGKWESIDFWTWQNLYEDCDSAPEFEPIQVYNGRFYQLFGKLTGTVRWYDPNPIDYARGLPVQISKPVQEWWNWFKPDGHTPSWFTLKELKEWVKEQKQPQTMPSMCENCKYRIEYEEEYEYEDETAVVAAIEGIIVEIEKRVIGRSPFCYKIESEALDLIKEHEDDIRIVFWFDN